MSLENRASRKKALFSGGFHFTKIVCFLQFLPESARYLVAAGKSDEAMVILHQAAKLNRSSLPKGEIIDSATVSSRGTIKLVC